MSAGQIYFFVISPLILTFAVWQTVVQIRFFRRSVPARGRIIGLNPQLYTGGKTKKTFYYPIVEFVNEHNERREFVGGLGSSLKYESRIGREVSVRYIPGTDVQTAKVWTVGTVVFPLVVFFLFGGGLLWLAIQGGPGFQTEVRFR